MGLLTLGAGISLTLLPTHGTPFFLLVGLVQPFLIVILVCPVWLPSLGGLVFSEEKMEGRCFGRRERGRSWEEWSSRIMNVIY